MSVEAEPGPSGAVMVSRIGFAVALIGSFGMSEDLLTVIQKFDPSGFAHSTISAIGQENIHHYSPYVALTGVVIFYLGWLLSKKT